MLKPRDLTRLTVAIGLGVVTSVLLAWTLRCHYLRAAAQPTPQPLCLIRERGTVWETLILRQPGRYSVFYQRVCSEEEWPAMNTGAVRAMDPAEEPGWVRRVRLSVPGVVSIGGYGVPWKCLKSFGIGQAPPRSFGIIETPRWLGPLGSLRLPVSPIWPGLIASSLIWGTAWWAVLAGPPAVRKRWRLARCRCPACGYSLMGLSNAAKCPECGVAAGS